MKHATTGANTLPSGYAAGSLAVALAVIETMPWRVSILLALAVTISVAAVITRTLRRRHRHRRGAGGRRVVAGWRVSPCYHPPA